MTSSTGVHQCDYLRLHSFSPVFASERAELIHVDKQIALLDGHISQLNASREALRLRSRRLHNSLLPIHTLPVEVLSYILQQLANLYPVYSPVCPLSLQRLPQAFTLSSVSSHFRHVAFNTPMLWRDITLCMYDAESTERAEFLVEHCIALSPSVNIRILDALDEQDVYWAVDSVLTPEATRKLKEFEMYTSHHVSIWAEKLKGSTFPMLDTLTMRGNAVDPMYDFGTLNILTSLSIFNHSLSHLVTAPPSIQHLYLSYVAPLVFLSLVQQCLNLVNCEVDFDPEFDGGLVYTQLTEPVTLNHLKRLVFRVIEVTDTRVLVDRIRMPALDTLQLDHCPIDTFISILPLCHNVSATLTKLVINTCSDTLDYDDLYQVCMLSFPKLEKLEFWSTQQEPFEDAIHAFALVDNECSDSGTNPLPAIRTILLRCNTGMKPRSLLELLTKWRIGESLPFYLRFGSCLFDFCLLSPELREEFSSIVGGRRIQITCDDHQV